MRTTKTTEEGEQARKILSILGYTFSLTFPPPPIFDRDSRLNQYRFNPSEHLIRDRDGCLHNASIACLYRLSRISIALLILSPGWAGVLIPFSAWRKAFNPGVPGSIPSQASGVRIAEVSWILILAFWRPWDLWRLVYTWDLSAHW